MARGVLHLDPQIGMSGRRRSTSPGVGTDSNTTDWEEFSG